MTRFMSIGVADYFSLDVRRTISFMGIQTGRSTNDTELGVGRGNTNTLYNVQSEGYILGQHCMLMAPRHPFVFVRTSCSWERQTSSRQTWIRLKLTLGSFGHVLKETTPGRKTRPEFKSKNYDTNHITMNTQDLHFA